MIPRAKDKDVGTSRTWGHSTLPGGVGTVFRGGCLLGAMSRVGEDVGARTCRHSTLTGGAGTAFRGVCLVGDNVSWVAARLGRTNAEESLLGLLSSRRATQAQQLFATARAMSMPALHFMHPMKVLCPPLPVVTSSNRYDSVWRQRLRDGFRNRYVDAAPC